jgi:hypothetical protein
MTKNEIQQRVLQKGKPLKLELFSWDENARVFATNEDHLVIDFFIIDDCTFKTGHGCTFKTGPGCTFNTGSYCTFNTGSYCTFDTSSNCTFNTGSDCTFTTGQGCICVRRDVIEFFQIPNGKTIKLNGYRIIGYTYIDEIKEFKEFTVARTVKAKTQEEAEKLVLML